MYFDIRRWLVSCAAAVCMVVLVIRAEAVTTTLQRNINNNNLGTPANDGNRPWFSDNYSDGTIIFTNPDGYFGSVLPGVSNTTTVANTNVGIGGDGTNGVPMGVGFNFGISFNISIAGPGDPTSMKLTDGGNEGLGVTSSATDTQPLRLNSSEQLLFSNIQLTNVSIQDPLGLLQALPLEQAVNNALWNVLRSMDFSGSDVATIADAGNQVIKTFNSGTPINNNFTTTGTGATGAFTPTSSVNLTTTAGNWRLKGIGFQVNLNYDLAPVPASRRTFMLGEVSQTVQYEGNPSAQLTDIGTMDTNLTIAAVGDGALLDTNDIGVGSNSITDGTSTIDELAFQRRIHGALGEAIQLSFNREVSLESLTVGSLNLDGSERVILSFVSGTNPFTGLTGYSGEYALDANSITFNRTAGGQTPYTITFGMNGQDQINIAAGTVLGLTAIPIETGDYNGDGFVDAADYVLWRKGDINGTLGYTNWRANYGSFDDGGIILDIITVNIPPGAGSGSSLGAVPEPASTFLLMVAAAGCCVNWRRGAK